MHAERIPALCAMGVGLDLGWMQHSPNSYQNLGDNPLRYRAAHDRRKAARVTVSGAIPPNSGTAWV